MNAVAYQKEAHKFATYGDNIMYPALGLSEEAGEVAGKIAKFIRKHGGQSPIPDVDAVIRMIDDGDLNSEFVEDMNKFKSDVEKELGDVMWMVAELCTVYGLDLEEVMENNIAKLDDRKSRGVIVGEGDNR